MGEGTEGQLVRAGERSLVVVSDEDPEIARIKGAIEDARDKLAQSFTDLQQEVDERLDWQGWVREHPWKAVGLAFAAGLFFGSG